MTRLPGEELGQVYEKLSREDQEAALLEMQAILQTMRQWQHPWGGKRICSISGTSIRSVRVPRHSAGPCESEQEFHEYLLSPSVGYARRAPSQEVFEEKLARAKSMQSLPHPIVFTHGDLKHHNIMFYNGHVSGFLDWESAGWYPAYWDFTTALRFCPKDFWWYGIVTRLGGSECLKEVEIERALTTLTADSYAW
jgi:aminoglycoside phosphotransferase (APT) family kinase protein